MEIMAVHNPRLEEGGFANIWGCMVCGEHPKFLWSWAGVVDEEFMVICKGCLIKATEVIDAAFRDPQYDLVQNKKEEGVGFE